MDSAPAVAHRAATSGHVLRSVVLLWLAGIGLRITILAVPPLIRLIHDDLALTETQVGILSGLPPVLFAVAAVAGSLLIVRFGAIPAVVTGLAATALGCALRGAAPDFGVLCAATVLAGLGVAIMQPAMPALVRAWLPQRIGFGTAVWTNGLLIGEIIPVALTMPLVLPLAGDSWRLAFVAWALPAAAIGVVFLRAGSITRPAAAAAAKPALFMPDWRSPVMWRLGLMFGATNASYFSTNAFIPDYLHHIGEVELIGPALTALNIGQLPASLLLLACAGRVTGRAWPYAAGGALSLVCVAAILAGHGTVIVAAAGLLGFSCATTLVLLLSLPPLVTAPADTHRMTAGMLTISYSCAVIVPVLSGLLWDASAIAAVAFVPIGLCNLLLTGVAASVPAAIRKGGAHAS